VDGNAALSAEGWVDYQAHGYIHNIPISNGSDDEFITAKWAEQFPPCKNI
jgi:hypothetical protein